MSLSAKQMEYLAIAWQCFETEPKIDFDKFHKLANLASPASARELMRVTKNKLREEHGALGGAKVPATPKKGKAAAGAGAKTPGSRKRATPASGTGKKKGGKKGAEEEREGSVELEDSEIEDESPRKKAKRNGKGATAEEVKVKEEPQEEYEVEDEFEEANHFM